MNVIYDLIVTMLDIPHDRKDLVIVFSVTLGIVVLSLFVAVVQGTRHKPSAKIWVMVSILPLIIFVALVLTCRLSTISSYAEIEQRRSAESSVSDKQEDVSFDEIYREYMANELRGDEKYKGNRYRVTAKINGMETDGLLNLSGGATLTMETRVDNTIVFFYAEFEKEQEEALKEVDVGDTITFEGKCLSAGSWVDCTIIETE